MPGLVIPSEGVLRFGKAAAELLRKSAPDWLFPDPTGLRMTVSRVAQPGSKGLCRHAASSQTAVVAVLYQLINAVPTSVMLCSACQ